MKKIWKKVFGSRKNRFFTISSSSIKEGGVQNNVDRYLRDVENCSACDVQAIKFSTCVKSIDYCQSTIALILFLRSEGRRGRPARGKEGEPNHDFVIFHLTARKSDGQQFDFSISAEKEGGGQGGGDSGIYINVLPADERLHLRANILKSWDGFSTPVPLDVLTRSLWEGHDTHYNLINNNCWHYAQAVVKSVLLLLSQRPHVNHKHKRYFERNAQVVKIYVLMKDKWQFAYVMAEVAHGWVFERNVQVVNISELMKDKLQFTYAMGEIMAGVFD